MIGLALHLAARGLDTLRAEASEARSVLGWCLAFAALGRGTPDPSEVEQLASEVDLLRDERDRARTQVETMSWNLEHAWKQLDDAVGERDQARAQFTDAQALAHEARLEYGAARETCEQLRGELATARRERDEMRAAAQAFVDALDHGDCDTPFKCDDDRCSRIATRRALEPCGYYCDEHDEASASIAIDRSYAPALRVLHAALTAKGASRG